MKRFFYTLADAKAQHGEVLFQIKSMREMMNAHYLRVLEVLGDIRTQLNAVERDVHYIAKQHDLDLKEVSLPPPKRVVCLDCMKSFNTPDTYKTHLGRSGVCLNSPSAS